MKSNFAQLAFGLLTTVSARPQDLGPVDPESVQCSAEYINDAEHPDLRWDAAGAGWAYKVASARWTIDQLSDTPSSLSFTEFIGNLFNSKDLLVCTNMADGPCQDTMTCDDVNQPAGFLILNSFVSLHVFRRTVYDSLQGAMNQMQNSMGLFQDIFSPADTPDSSWLNDVLTVFQFVVGIGSAYSWNIALKGSKLITNSNTYAFAQESANAAIGLGFTWAKTHLPTASEIQNDLTNSMGNLFQVWIESELEFLKTLFSGASDSILTLESLIDKGLALEITRNLDLGGFVNVAQKIMYAKLLPLAWKTSSVKIKDLPSGPMHPMILMLPDDCDSSNGELTSYVDNEKAENMKVCHDKHTFFVGFPTWKGVSKSDHISRLVVWALPGGEHDVLNGADWGGLTLDDIVISSYEGYRLNDYKNGYSIPENSQIVDGTGSQGSLIMEMGIQTPGFMSLPICTPQKLERVSSKWNANVINGHAIDDLLEQIPCGDGALTPEEMAAFGFS
ncbi:hypothetical protein AK830_g6050 [Neonectria ditissima]|uniref:Carboxylic ester hydrolase n=1 Tax=Neonectria ditissima TaxID=78410 RepID=A0A0P7BD97_9HYPO|nr:hypothetical protein AK830_g6050 [Neonectria ditissima]